MSFSGIRKRSVEECVYFDADELHHHVVRMGKRLVFEVTCRDERRTVLIVPRVQGLAIVQSFDGRTIRNELETDLEATETPIGGFRHWFRCPDCRTRRKRLYIVPFGSRVACRVCLRLVHRSTQINRRPHMGLAMLVARGTGFSAWEVAAQMGKWWREDREVKEARRRSRVSLQRREMRKLVADQR